MIKIKDKRAREKMVTAGYLLTQVCAQIEPLIVAGTTTLDLDKAIAGALHERKLVSQSKGYKGYQHVSCISINDEVVHGVPHMRKVLKRGDLVKVDICASWNGYCADMARCFFVGSPPSAQAQHLVDVAYRALDKGINQAVDKGRLGDISAAIQEEVEQHGFSVVRDFAGHGIGQQMHEEPEVLNYGIRGHGPVLRTGMALAIEPMITAGDFAICIERDGWTARTRDGSLAAHVEDTVLITDHGPHIITRSA